MKYLVKFFVVTFFFIFSTQAFAEQKIVVLDMKYVLNSSTAGKGAQEFLKKKFNDNIKKFSDMENALKKEETDLLGKRTILSKEVYANKVDELRKKVIDFQSQKRLSDDKNTALWSKLRTTLIKQIKPILDSYIKANDISLVIDKKGMIGGLIEYDITEIIIEKLDTEFPSLNLQ